MFNCNDYKSINYLKLTLDEIVHKTVSKTDLAVIMIIDIG